MSSVTDQDTRRLVARCLRISRWLLFPLFPVMTAAIYGAFIYAPTERVMLEVQRIFYFHVGAAWNALYVCFLVVFLAGIAYLMTRRAIWDRIAATCVEIGLLFTTINLVTGSLWAKPIWGTWWPWGDPRVMSMLALWLIYVAYLIFRSSLPDGDRRYKFCAVFGIIGFIDVPIVHASIRIWRTHHPVVIKSTGMNLEPEMIVALFTAVVAFSLLLGVFFCLRLAVRLQQSMVDDLLWRES